MILSVNLLVATLAVSQFSGVVGAKQEREQLRRSLRKGAETQRKTQFSINGAQDPTYDDFFAISEPLADVQISDVDDFFKHTDTGMAFDWDAAGEEHSHEVEIEHSHGEAEEDHDHESRIVGSKSSKLGKAMWDEAPMVKGGKSGKGVKAAVSIKGAKGELLAKAATKSAKSAKSNSYYSSDHDDDHEHESRADSHSEDENHEDAFGESEDGWLSAFDQSEALSYADLFESNHKVTPRNDFADPTHVSSSAFKANGGSTLMTGRMESPPAQEGPSSRATYDDDYFNEEERLVFLPRPTVTVACTLFSVNPQTVITPVVPDGSGNTLTLGTRYLYNEIMTDAQNILSQILPVQVDNEQVPFVVALDGYCDRIGPPDTNSVQGYCFFTYTFIDYETQLTAGSFTAQGIIVTALIPAMLTVSGGTGIMTGATGVVEILPASVDSAMNPPELIQPIDGIDPFNDVAGWAHFVTFDVDVLFFLPELYA